MNKNVALLLVLMALLAGVAGFLLFGPTTGGGEVLGKGGDQAELEADRGAALGGQDAAGTEGETTPGRVEVDVPRPPRFDANAARPAPDRTTLTGRVLAPSGAPLADAAIELWSSSDALQPPDLGLDLPGAPRPTAEHPDVLAHHTTRTDGAGRFTFEDLGARRVYHHVEVRAAGLAPLFAFALQPRPGRVRDLGDMRMMAPGTLAGVVTTEDGLPVRGAAVYLGSEGILSRSADEPLREVGTTDGLGRFQIDELPAGAYVVGAVGYGLAMNFSDDTTLDADTPLVDDLEIELRAGFPFVAEVVDGESGAAIAGARVTVRPNWGNNTQRLELVTDAAGRFEHPGLVDQNWTRVWIEAEGYSSLSSNVRASAEQAGRVQRTFELHTQHTVTVRVVDADGQAPIAGAWIVESSNRPNDFESAIRAGWAVPSLEAEGEGTYTTDAAGEARLPLTRTAPWLSVAAPGYAPRTLFDAPRHGGGERGIADLADAEYVVELERGATLDVHVTGSGAPLAGVEVELRIASHDLAADNEAERNVRSRNWRRGGSRFDAGSLAWNTEEGLVPVDRRTTDGGGDALFAGVSGGLYYLEVRAPAGLGFGTASHGPIAIAEDTTDVGIEVELEPAGRVDGVVMFRGQPAPGQRVLLVAAADAAPLEEGRDLPRRALVLEELGDEGGRFAFEAVEPGPYKAVALLPYSVSDNRGATSSSSAIQFQLIAHSQLVEVLPATTSTLTLEGQSPGARLSGVVRVNHQAVRGAQVRGSWSSPDGGRQSFRARTDANGYWETEGLLPGEWVLTASATSTREEPDMRVDRQWRRFYRGSAFVPDTGDAVHDINNEAGALVLTLETQEPAETPKDESGVDLPLANVYWTRVRLSPDAEAGGVSGLGDDDTIDIWIDHRRTQLIDLLPGGHYTLTLSSNAFDPLTRPLEVLPGADSKAHFEPVLNAEKEDPTNWFFD